MPQSFTDRSIFLCEEPPLRSKTKLSFCDRDYMTWKAIHRKSMMNFASDKCLVQRSSVVLDKIHLANILNHLYWYFIVAFYTNLIFLLSYPTLRLSGAPSHIFGAVSQSNCPCKCLSVTKDWLDRVPSLHCIDNNIQVIFLNMSEPWQKMISSKF